MMKKGNILIVDDNPNYRDLIAMILEKEYRVQGASNGAHALDLLAEESFDLVLLDAMMPGMSGLDALKAMKSRWPETEIIMITVISDTKSTVEAIKHGAHDYIVKGSSTEEILNRVENLFEKIRRDRKLNLLSQDFASFLYGGMFIGPSEASRRLLEELDIAASCDATCLITGETGVGKGLAAAYIHRLGRGPDKPLVAVSLPAIPKDMVESTLFGVERGAFPDALQSRAGKFELADSGTILLDEIGELSLEHQAKLLQIIEEREVERIGSNRKRFLNVRILAAASCDLRKRIEDGSFRDDLFYRLNVMSIHVPALRERVEDIQPLATHFLDLYNRRYRKQIAGFAPEVSDVLRRQTWRGNIRELAHLVERMVIYARGDAIGTSDLPIDYFISIQTNQTSEIFEKKKEFLEKEMIQRALARNRFNKSKTARELGVPVETLRYRIWKLGITKDVGDD